jgi:hypothetical protein
MSILAGIQYYLIHSYYLITILGTVTDGEFSCLRTQGENRPLHLWQIIHDVREVARRMSKKLLMGCLELKSSTVFFTFLNLLIWSCSLSVGNFKKSCRGFIYNNNCKWKLIFILYFFNSV